MARKASGKEAVRRGERPGTNSGKRPAKRRKAAPKGAARHPRIRKLSPAEIAAFRKDVYAHYRAHKRDLPWRRTRDPYQILVSEMMLQQTQVSRVVPKFVEFVSRFPTARALAAAPLGEVLKTWAGLGYNRRAKMLREAAGALVERHGGTLPSTYEALRALPGIGDYTASAILAFAFGVGRPLIETNVRAVIIRHFFPRKRDVSEAEILSLTDQTLDRENPRDWYAAFMDYGAHLKSAEGNHARRSAHHGKVKKTPFKGSARQVRGEALKVALAAKSGATVAAIARAVSKKIGVAAEAVRAAIEGLARDGLVRKRGARILPA